MRNEPEACTQPLPYPPIGEFCDAALSCGRTEAKMTTTCDEKHIELKPISSCRREVEVAMVEMLVSLQKRGWSAAELALELADASEDLVMMIATKRLRPN